jgi:HPt (histidine-containing phosphotransfer) domain-containing protein
MERERPRGGPRARGTTAERGDPPGAREALERLRRFGGDRLVRDMAAVFLADTPARLARAQAGLAAGDAAALAYAAHTMKSSALQFGAAALGRLCGDAERAARGGDHHALAPLVAAMARELDGFGAWLERELRAVAEPS